MLLNGRASRALRDLRKFRAGRLPIGRRLAICATGAGHCLEYFGSRWLFTKWLGGFWLILRGEFRLSEGEAGFALENGQLIDVFAVL